MTASYTAELYMYGTLYPPDLGRSEGEAGDGHQIRPGGRSDGRHPPGRATPAARPAVRTGSLGSGVAGRATAVPARRSGADGRDRRPAGGFDCGSAARIAGQGGPRDRRGDGDRGDGGRLTGVRVDVERPAG